MTKMVVVDEVTVDHTQKKKKPKANVVAEGSVVRFLYTQTNTNEKESRQSTPPQGLPQEQKTQLLELLEALLQHKQKEIELRDPRTAAERFRENYDINFRLQEAFKESRHRPPTE
jgi:ferric-dicitrate binding protein FerR (iron transport regulator)